MRIFLTLAVAAFLVGLVKSQTGEITVNTTSRFMIDGARRPTIFHGVNVVYKVDPFIPTTNSTFDPQISLNDKDIEDMVKWGFNFVRLGVMWEAVEKQAGVYDTTYLQKVNDLITKLGARGIYTMVDAHQDVLSRHICGEGMPTFYSDSNYLNDKCHGTEDPWAVKLFGPCKSIKDFGFRLDQNGLPLIEDCNKNSFVRYFQTPEFLSAFDNLYENKKGIQDKFASFWDKVSQTFANNTYVIGYDPINEPYPSDYWVDPTLITEVGKFDRVKLQPLYSRIYNTYRQHSNKKIMYFEPGQFPDTAGVDGGRITPLGFTMAPGGQGQNLTTQVLNDHSYCCQKDPTMCATGEPPLQRS